MSGIRTHLSKALLVVQIALSLVLLIGAGLFIRTVRNLRNVDVGFSTNNLLLFRVNPGALKYDTARMSSVYQELLARTAALPSVLQATFSDYPLVIGSGNDMRITFQASDPAEKPFSVARLLVNPNFFEAIGVPLVSGRSFTPRDNESRSRVAVVNESFVRRFFQGGKAVGEHFLSFIPQDRLRAGSMSVEIVGVVKDVSLDIARVEVRPTVYLPVAQLIPSFAAFTVRTSGDPYQIVSAVREAARQVDPNLPVSSIRTQTEQIEQGFATERVFAIASTFFGGIAVVLACIGLFGLMSYSVERRTNEIGLRMALGANRRDVVSLVMRQMTVVLLTGLLLGIVSALAVTQTISSMLFRVASNDAMTMVLAIAIISMVVCAAAYVPARRGASVDPAVALRCD